MLRRFMLYLLICFSCSLVYAKSQQNLWSMQPDYRAIQLGEGELISLWHEEETPRKLGSVLLLPDWGNYPSSPEIIDPLRLELPKVGWETIAIVPPQSEQSSNLLLAEQPDDEGTKSYKEGLVLMLQAIEQAKSEQFGFQLVIAQGVMAAWILEVYQDGSYPLPDALILIGSYLPQPQRNKAIAQQIANLPRPVLDIFFTHNNNWVQSGAEPRRIAANKQQKLDYRQIQIDGERYWAETGTRTSKLIYGWLSSIGWY